MNHAFHFQFSVFLREHERVCVWVSQRAFCQTCMVLSFNARMFSNEIVCCVREKWKLTAPNMLKWGWHMVLWLVVVGMTPIILSSYFHDLAAFFFFCFIVRHFLRPHPHQKRKNRPWFAWYFIFHSAFSLFILCLLLQNHRSNTQFSLFSHVIVGVCMDFHWFWNLYHMSFCVKC